MPFGPAIAFFVFGMLYLNQHLTQIEEKRKAEEKKKREQAKEDELKAKLLVEFIRDKNSKK